MTRRAGGRLQTVGAGLLVLAVSVAAPGLSIAQQDDPQAGTGPDITAPSPEAGTIPDVAAPAPEPTSGEAPSPGPVSGEAPESDDPSTDASGQVPSEAEAEATGTEAAPAEDAGEPRAKAAADRTVGVGDNFYKPAKITIDVGDTVTWRNDGLADHTATAEDGSFDTGTFGSGERRSETFDSAGTIPYYCLIHGTAQSGTIEVRAAGGGGGGGGGGGSGGGGASSSGTSEAAAASSPGAAGSSSSLPATGIAALTLGAIGLALISSGSALRQVGRPRRGSRLFSL